MSGLAKLAASPKAQGATLLLLVFLAGALVGGALERIRTVQTRPARPWLDRGKPFPEGGEEPWGEREVLPRPLEELDLTDQQRDHIVEILESSRPVTDSIMMQTMPQLMAVRDSVSARIREVLTPQQLERLEREMEGHFLPPSPLLRPMGPPGFRDSTRRFR